MNNFMSSPKPVDENNFIPYFRPIVSSLRSITNVRALAYTSEIGEASRPIVPKGIVNLAYGLSFGYVFADMAVKIHDVQTQGQEQMLWTGIDSGIFHTSASIVTPAVVIHSIVKFAGKIQTKILNSKNITGHKYMKFIPSIIGLVSIPFIIHPIDHGTEYIMDHTIRPYYPVKVSYLHNAKDKSE